MLVPWPAVSVGMLFSGLSLMFWLSFFNLFLRLDGLMTIQLYLGLLVMAGFVLYDTQLIVAKARLGLTDYVWHASELFTDVIGIFVRLLIILTRNRESDEDRRRRRR